MILRLELTVGNILRDGGRVSLDVLGGHERLADWGATLFQDLVLFFEVNGVRKTKFLVYFDHF